MVKREIINFEAPKKLTLLDSREVGEKDRQRYKLNEKDNDELYYEFIFPERIFAMNVSYFLAFLGPSVNELGVTGFREKYSFDNCSDVIKANIDAGLSRAVRIGNAL